jgi:hypothetical protein
MSGWRVAEGDDDETKPENSAEVEEGSLQGPCLPGSTSSISLARSYQECRRDEGRDALRDEY